ncbi:hypothetical protein AB0P40_43415 [Streptomyces sp. NPDC079189]|uniref:hypothetical protein n=1 Tax=Actinomycetes TaxID=1760 RepID=UPI00342B8E5B
MTVGDVHTRERNGVWENIVEGELDRKWVFTDASQAIANGERVAKDLRSSHLVHSSEDSDTQGVEVPPYVQGA